MSKTEKLTQNQETEIKKLLNDFIKEIKEKNSSVAEKIELKISELETKMNTFEDANDLLDSIADELDELKKQKNFDGLALKEYNEFKNSLTELIKKVEEIKEKTLEKKVQELAELQKQIWNNLAIDPKNPEHIKIAASKGRKMNFEEIKNLEQQIFSKSVNVPIIFKPLVALAKKLMHNWSCSKITCKHGRC